MEQAKKKIGVLVNSRAGPAHQICSFTWADNHWIMSHSKTHLEQMMKDLIEEAERWDLEPKPASLWWTSTSASEMMEDITIGTRSGQHRVLKNNIYEILGYTFNQAGLTQDCLEDRMHNSKTTWWRDVKIYRRQDVPWRMRCRRIVVHVCSVFCLGSENWTWSQAILDRIEGWETKAMRRLFRFKKKVDEDFTGYCQGTAPEQFGQR